MNQILVTKKLYITPELKKKKKVYKFNFIFSIFLIGILMSCYIYAEYDRNKSEEVSQEILANMQEMEKDNTVANSNVLMVVLNNDNASEGTEGETVIQQNKEQIEYLKTKDMKVQHDLIESDYQRKRNNSL